MHEQSADDSQQLRDTRESAYPAVRSFSRIAGYLQTEAPTVDLEELDIPACHVHGQTDTQSNIPFFMGTLLIISKYSWNVYGNRNETEIAQRFGKRSSFQNRWRQFLSLLSEETSRWPLSMKELHLN